MHVNQDSSGLRLRRAAWLLGTGYAASLIGWLSSLLFTPIVIQQIGRDGYGLWAVILGIVGYFMLFDLGVTASIVRSVAHVSGTSGFRNSLASIIPSAAAVLAVSSTVAFVLCLVIALSLGRFVEIPSEQQANIGVTVTILGVGISIGLIGNLFGAVLRGLQYGHIIETTGTLVGLCGVGLSLLLLHVGFGIQALAIGFAVSSAILAVLQYLQMKRVVPGLRIKWTEIRSSQLRGIASYGLLIVSGAFAGRLVFSTDTLVAGAIIGVEAAAAYQITYKAAEICMQLIFRISDSAYPAISELHGRSDTVALRQGYLDALTVTAAASVGAAILCMWLNEAFVAVWVGEQLFGGGLLNLYFSYLIVHHGVLHVSGVVLVATGRVRVSTIAAGVEAVLNLLTSIILARYIGLPGIALGTIVAGVATSAWYVPQVTCRELGVSGRDYVMRGLRPAIVSGLLSLGCGAALRLVLRPDTAIAVLFCAVVTLLVYCACFLWIGLDLNDRHRYRARLVALWS